MVSNQSRQRPPRAVRLMNRSPIPWRLVVQAVGLGLALLAAACSSGDSSPSTPTAVPPRSGSPVPTASSTESPADGAIRLERLLATSGYDAYYEQIHPAIRQFVAKSVFLDCAAKGQAGVMQHASGITASLVRDLRDALFTPENFVPASDQPKVVTLTAQDANGGTSFNRFVAVADGTWHWFLAGSAMQAYQAQKCPDASP